MDVPRGPLMILRMQPVRGRPELSKSIGPISRLSSLYFAASGGTDLGARLLASYLEKDLGVPVVVENKVGAAGWVAYADLVNAKPDGYTLGVIVNPALITGYINPSANRKENLDSFEHIINHGLMKDSLLYVLTINVLQLLMILLSMQKITRYP